MQDLLALKEALEKPGVGKYRHDLAESFKGKIHTPIGWIRKWLNADWHTIGHKYLWLAAMNACIGRYGIPVGIIYRGLSKPDPDTFNAAVEACRGLKVKPVVISCWCDSPNPIFRIAAMTACINKPWTIMWLTEKIECRLSDSDIRVQRLAEELLKTRKID